MNRFLSLMVPALIVSALCLVASSYRVPAHQLGVVERHGQLLAAGLQPGWHLRLPGADQVTLLESRSVASVIDLPASTAIQPSLAIELLAEWQIADAGIYYAATHGNSHDFEADLQSLAKAALAQLGPQPEAMLQPGSPLWSRLQQQVDAGARTRYGVKLLSLAPCRRDLLDDAQPAVLAHMNSALQAQEAALQASGRAEVAAVQTDAEQRRRQILADAERRALVIRGEGDGEAARITSSTVGGDIEFYRYYRSLQAYSHSLNKPGDVLVLRSDDELLKYLRPTKR